MKNEESRETKETYETPKMEIIEIDAEDIIFSSGCSSDSECSEDFE